MTSSRTITWSLGIWAFVLALYAGVSLSHPRGSQTLVAFGDVVQCTVPLIANAGLLLNAGTPYWRRNIFWMLIALSCTLWMIGQFEWTYYEVYLHKPLPGLYPGDILFFLRGIPLIAALALQPHRKRGEVRARLGYLDFGLLLAWWTFVYIFFVMPWLYATPDIAQYNHNFNVITDTQNGLIVLGLMLLWLGKKCTSICSALLWFTCWPLWSWMCKVMSAFITREACTTSRLFLLFSGSHWPA